MIPGWVICVEIEEQEELQCAAQMEKNCWRLRLNANNRTIN